MVDRLVNSEANSRRISVVEAAFGISGVPLVVPGRVLVGEGILTKICRKKAKPRQFYLFNDILVYGSIIINKKKFNRQHIIPLEQVKLEELKDEEVLKNGWFIKTPRKSFAVYAATNTEKTEWMQHILKCVNDLLKRTGKQTADDSAAVFVPDNEAKLCMHCSKSQFTFMNRRHHCRNCGAVVCGPCSKHRFLLSAQSSRPVRVCDTCFEDLSRGRLGPINRVSKTASEAITPVTPSVADVDKSNGNIPDTDTVVISGVQELKIADPSIVNSSDSDDDDEEDDDEISGEGNASSEVGLDEAVLEKPRFYSASFNFEDESKQEDS